MQYTPHAAQVPFHKDRWTYRYRGVFAGTGAGKSLMGAQEALDFSEQLKGSVGLIAEPTYKKISEVVIPTFEDLLGNDFYRLFSRFDKAKMKLERNNGSVIWMIGLDNPEAAEGINLDWAWLDEARLVPKFQEAINSILRRLRGSGRAVPQRDYIPEDWSALWVTTTPNHPGSDMNRMFEGRKALSSSKVYRMSIMDNHHLPAEYIENIQSTHTGGLYDRFVLGKFAAVGGVAFEYDYTVHTQDFSTPDIRSMSIRYGVDFGWTNPSAIEVVRVDSDGRAYVIDEVYARQLSMEQLSDHLLKFYEKHGRGPVICDRSRPDNIQKFVDAGIDAVADESKRDDGIADLGGRFKVQGDGLARIYIHPECINLIDEIQTYDPEKKVRDHGIDSLRYCLAGLLSEAGPYDPTILLGRRPSKLGHMRY